MVGTLAGGANIARNSTTSKASNWVQGNYESYLKICPLTGRKTTLANLSNNKQTKNETSNYVINGIYNGTIESFVSYGVKNSRQFLSNLSRYVTNTTAISSGGKTITFFNSVSKSLDEFGIAISSSAAKSSLSSISSTMTGIIGGTAIGTFIDVVVNDKPLGESLGNNIDKAVVSTLIVAGFSSIPGVNLGFWDILGVGAVTTAFVDMIFDHKEDINNAVNNFFGAVGDFLGNIFN